MAKSELTSSKEALVIVNSKFDEYHMENSFGLPELLNRIHIQMYRFVTVGFHNKNQIERMIRNPKVAVVITLGEKKKIQSIATKLCKPGIYYSYEEHQFKPILVYKEDNGSYLLQTYSMGLFDKNLDGSMNASLYQKAEK